MTDKLHIEKRLRRAAGMSSANIEKMHAAAENETWWARCWSCQHRVEGTMKELRTTPCPYCGAELMNKK